MPNLRNPVTFNEKLQWKKLHGYRPIHTIIADKYAVREYVAARIGRHHLVPLIAVLNSVEELVVSALPDSFVIKATHGSGQNVIVHDKHSIQEIEFKRVLRGWFRENHYQFTKEPQYRDIVPRLIIEELITDVDGGVPMDFKFHCFHGEIEAIQVDIDRFADHRRNFYDTRWELLPFTWSAWDRHGPRWGNGKMLEQPAELAQMIAIARALASEFDYIRVDLYDCRHKVYFGELTLHHGGGWERFDPPYYDALLGDKLVLRQAMCKSSK